MFSVALIGPDGAGKSTIARMLQETLPLPVKTLYMGINFQSSNVVLPWSHWIEQMQRWRAAQLSQQRGQPGFRQRKSVAWAMLRLLHRLTEEWHRQLVSWNYRRKGWVVVYDRHYRFDFEYESAGEPQAFDDRLHRWLLARLYPRPDLVIYLDAPAEVLFARKGENTLHWLETRRRAFIRQGQQQPDFVWVDATRPVGSVLAEVSRQILQFHQSPSARRRAFTSPTASSGVTCSAK